VPLLTKRTFSAQGTAATISAASLIREHRDELGGVIVEPFQRLIAPKPGFIEALRELTREHGIPLIFDEVVTGFRFAYGGAQQFYGVTPDLCTLGKIIGGGFPLAAIAGREDIMSLFDRGKTGDEKFLTQIGTLSGNPVAAVAGLATLEVLRQPGAYDRIFATGRTLMDGIGGMLAKAGLPAQVIGVPPLFDIVYASGDVHDYRATLRADPAMQRRFNVRFREGGILKGESKFYVSLAHDAADVKHTLDVVQKAIEAELAETRVPAQ
jgi:glutamate-1-semialdehyde 2,1-aminomutase